MIAMRARRGVCGLDVAEQEREILSMELAELYDARRRILRAIPGSQAPNEGAEAFGADIDAPRRHQCAACTPRRIRRVGHGRCVEKRERALTLLADPELAHLRAGPTGVLLATTSQTRQPVRAG